MNPKNFELVEKIKEKLLSQRKEFETNLLKKSKEEIMLAYVELFLYTRFKFFLMHLLEEMRYKDKEYFSTEELEKILNIDDYLYNLEMFYYSSPFDESLSFESIISYLKKVLNKE